MSRDMSPLFLHGRQGEGGREVKGIRRLQDVKEKRRRAAAVKGEGRFGLAE